MDVLIIILVIGLALGYFILHPIKTIKFTLKTIAVFILGIIGFSLLVGIPIYIIGNLL